MRKYLLTVEDRLLIKISQTVQEFAVEMIWVSSRQWKWHIVFDLLPITDFTSFFKRLSVAADVVRSDKPVQISSWLIT